jgi:hypothetical protein
MLEQPGTIKRVVIDTLPSAALVFLVLRLIADGLCAISVPSFAFNCICGAVGQLLCVGTSSVDYY